MSKRRITKQQRARIEKIQNAYQEAKQGLSEGLVITRFSKQVEIEDSQGRRLRCLIRPNLETLVAGDKVLWQTEGNHQGVVLSLCPRTSVLARPSASGLKPVAANITQLIIVIAPKPEISWSLLDSYLIIAQTLDLRALILMNKTDLLSQELKEEFIRDYQALGYPILFTNHQEDTKAIQEAMKQQVSVFIGQSGVGKSTLITRILPHETAIATSALSEGSELGQHTTSNSRYYHLECGGAIIDSPGVREFNLWQMDVQGIAKGYVEFLPFLSQCRFRNCLHVDTPGCGILQALNKGLISNKRYENFLKLCTSIKENY